MRNYPSAHHIIAKSTWGSSHYDNILEWDQLSHNAWNTLFKNFPFHIQMKILLDLQGKTINWDVSKDIIAYLANYRLWELYNSKCFSMKKMEGWTQVYKWKHNLILTK